MKKSTTPEVAIVRRTEVRTYVGRRVTTGNKLYHFWRYPDGKEYGSKKNTVAFASIGEMFVFSLDDQERTYIGGEHRPKLEVGKKATKEEITEWAAKDAANHQADIQRKADKKLAARKTEFEEALQPLRAMLDSLQFHDERSLFIQRVTSALWRREG